MPVLTAPAVPGELDVSPEVVHIPTVSEYLQYGKMVPVASRMNSDIREEWVGALRSGKYLQCFGALGAKQWFEPEMRFCALGVLCEIAADHGVVQRRDDLTVHRDGRGSITRGYSDIDDPFGRLIFQWSGFYVNSLFFLDSPAPRAPRETLVNLNDTYHWTFQDLADLIEAQA